MTANENILITGGAGYIGSHVAIDLIEEGFTPIVIDDLSTGNPDLVPPGVPFYRCNAGDAEAVGEVLRRHPCRAAMHFAGSIVVPHSVARPLAYYRNNTVVSRSLIHTLLRWGVEAMVFSSTAAVYGIPEQVPVDETAPTQPINPYGRSKLMTEWMLADVAVAEPFRYVALRYFNVAGADPLGRSGQASPEATHLIKVACETVLGKRPGMALFGSDYDTEDGTCVRDYIHVSDLARAHVLALRHLARGGASQVLNCGYGYGYSVRQVIETVERVAGRRINLADQARRPGDPPRLIADPARIHRVLDWSPRHADLEKIVADALRWERRRAN